MGMRLGIPLGHAKRQCKRWTRLCTTPCRGALNEGPKMFRYITFRWKLWRIERRRNRKLISLITPHAISHLRGQNSELGPLTAAEINKVRNEVILLHQRYLEWEAARLMIPPIDSSDQSNWEVYDPSLFGEQRMSTKGLNALRASIRSEKKARMEMFVMWLPSAIGMIGALTGLAAVLIGRGK
jgi:hypothetical protein